LEVKNSFYPVEYCWRALGLQEGIKDQ